MKNKLLILCCAAALISFPSFAGKIVTDSLKSEVLGVSVKYNVYLPDAYDSTSHYPVIYLLHGLSDTYVCWDELGHVDWVANELIASGECRPCVIIMPNAGGRPTRETWNGYFNMPGWNYEDFFFTELIPEVEKKFNAGGEKGQRAVMGGGGSVVYAQRHPDCFSSCYAMSPWLDNSSLGVMPPAINNDCLYYVCKAVVDHSAIEFVKKADSNTLEALRTVKWFVNIGDDDFLLDESISFYQIMRASKVKCELRICDGIHNWEYWHLALRTALPFASRNFTF